MWKKILILLIIILILLSSYALYIFFQNNKTTEKIEINNKQNMQRNENNETKKNKQSEEDEKNKNDYQTRAFHIEKKDCANECADFEDDVKGLYYCKNYCGLLPIKKDDSNKKQDCEEKTDLARDYCYRDNAVNSKDLKICEKISDRGIKQHCKNRVTEDIIDESF